MFNMAVRTAVDILGSISGWNTVNWVVQKLHKLLTRARHGCDGPIGCPLA